MRCLSWHRSNQNTSVLVMRWGYTEWCIARWISMSSDIRFAVGGVVFAMKLCEVVSTRFTHFHPAATGVDRLRLSLLKWPSYFFRRFRVPGLLPSVWHSLKKLSISLSSQTSKRVGLFRLFSPSFWSTPKSTCMDSTKRTWRKCPEL